MDERGRNIHNIMSIWAMFGACISPPSVLTDLIDPPEIIDFNFPYKELNVKVHVRLVPTESFLANENVPVWITSQSSEPADSSLISLNTMEKLTPFTVYRDHNSCSAALYFHRTKRLEGTIANHHIIHNLKYNPMTKKVKLSKDKLFKSTSMKHYEYRKLGEAVADTVQDKVPSLRAYPETVYIEILVLIDNDITVDFKNNYSSIVTYVLTLFNTVDMIYSKIETPNIKINIAGIIIGSVPFPRFTPECYDTFESRINPPIKVLRDLEAFKAIMHTLHDYKHHIPIQSYDIAVYLTRSRLFGTNPSGPMSKPFSCGGVAFPSQSPYKRSIADGGIAVISDPSNLQNFPTLAHEMAHLFGAPHDGGPLSTEDDSCLANLMRNPGSWCPKCIIFGGQTPKYLKAFFGSRDACIFHNKPRSLNDPQKPQLFWTPHEQCECYGYKSVHKTKNRVRIPFFRSSRINCQSELKCRNDQDTIEHTNVYMDGTPCAENRRGRNVCWKGQCLPLGISF